MAPRKPKPTQKRALKKKETRHDDEKYLERIKCDLELSVHENKERRKPKADNIALTKDVKVNNVNLGHEVSLAFVPLKCNGKPAIGMIDSGSMCNLVKLSLVQKLRILGNATENRMTVLRDVQNNEIASYREIEIMLQLGSFQIMRSV